MARAVAAVASRVGVEEVVEEVAAATDGPKAVAVPRAAVVRVVVRMVMRTVVVARAAVALATAVRVMAVGRAAVLAVVEAVEAAVVAGNRCM